MAFRDMGCHCLSSPNPADLFNRTWMLHRLPVLAVADAITLPDNFLGPALQLIAEDLRVATVSFLSNDAGFLSFPVKNAPVNQPPEGHDATSVSRRLRELGPHTLAHSDPDRCRSCGPAGSLRTGGRRRPDSRARRGRSRAYWLTSRCGLAPGASSISSTTRPITSATGRPGTRPTGSEPSTTSTLRSGTGSTRCIPTRWASSTTRRGRPPHHWRCRTGWHGPRSSVCGSPSTGPTSGRTRWAPRCPSWPRWRR